MLANIVWGSLIKALGDSDEGVREKAAYALGKIGDPSAIKFCPYCGEQLME